MKYEVDVYIFGSARTVVFEANESLEELKNDDILVHEYVACEISNKMIIQNGICEF